MEKTWRVLVICKTCRLATALYYLQLRIVYKVSINPIIQSKTRLIITTLNLVTLYIIIKLYLKRIILLVRANPPVITV
jgi:hypothetical protein